jgi:hypothetical protein
MALYKLGFNICQIWLEIGINQQPLVNVSRTSYFMSLRQTAEARILAHREANRQTKK